MQARTFLPVLLSTLFVAGCSSHTIREGIWELSLHGQDVRSREPAPLPTWKVQVKVDWSSEHSGEVVEIERLESQESYKNRVMWGDIPEGRPEVRIRAQDGYYVFKMSGDIRNPEHMSGTFLARHRYEEHTAFEGRWEMSWTGD